MRGDGAIGPWSYIGTRPGVVYHDPMRTLLALLLLVGHALAQDPLDAMDPDQALSGMEPSARVDLLLDRSEAIRRNEPRQAIELATEARVEAAQLRDDARLMRADLSIGVGHYFLGEYRQAMEAYRRTLDLAESIGDSLHTANALNNIGVLYFVWGEHDVAIEFYMRALAIQEQLGDRAGLGRAYNNVAAVLQTAGERDSALDYFRRSLAIYEEVGDLGLQAGSLNNIGLLHSERQEYGQAMAAYERALEFGQQLGDMQHAALTLNNMGMVLEARGDLGGALARYQESLRMREDLEDQQGALVCRHNIGVVQSLQGRHEIALDNLRRALADARRLEVLELERDALENLALALERAGQPGEALQIFQDYKAADDRLRDQERTRQLLAAQTRHEVDLKDREIEVLRKDKEIEQSRRNALAVGAVLSLLIIVLLFQRYRFQKRTADEIRRANEALRQAHGELEAAARAELTHVARVATMGELAAAFAHELNQPLAAIQANARAGRNYLHAPAPDPGEVDGALDDIDEDAGRAQEIIANLRRLMRKGEIRREPVQPAAMVADALRVIEPECRRQGVRVQARLDDGLPAVLGDRVQLQQVVLNLVQNAATALAGSDAKAPTIVVAAVRDDDAVVVSVRDGGPPITDEVFDDMFEPFFTTRPRGLGMGLAICRTIIEAHGGELTARRNEGTGLTVGFRVPGGGH